LFLCIILHLFFIYLFVLTIMLKRTKSIRFLINYTDFEGKNGFNRFMSKKYAIQSIVYAYCKIKSILINFFLWFLSYIFVKRMLRSFNLVARCMSTICWCFVNVFSSIVSSLQLVFFGSFVDQEYIVLMTIFQFERLSCIHT